MLGGSSGAEKLVAVAGDVEVVLGGASDAEGVLGGGSDAVLVFGGDSDAVVVLVVLVGVEMMFWGEGGVDVVLGWVVQCAELSHSPSVAMQAQGSLDSTGIRNASLRRPR